MPNSISDSCALASRIIPVFPSYDKNKSRCSWLKLLLGPQLASAWGAFNNYVDKKRGKGVSRKSTSSRDEEQIILKCPFLFTRGVRGPKLDKIWSTQLLNAPLVLPPSLLCLTRKHDPGPDGEILLLPYVHVGIGYIYVRTSTYVQLCCLSVSFGIIASITNGSSCCMQKMTMTK